MRAGAGWVAHPIGPADLRQLWELAFYTVSMHAAEAYKSCVGRQPCARVRHAARAHGQACNVFDTKSDDSLSI